MTTLEISTHSVCEVRGFPMPLHEGRCSISLVNTLWGWGFNILLVLKCWGEGLSYQLAETVQSVSYFGQHTSLFNITAWTEQDSLNNMEKLITEWSGWVSVIVGDYFLSVTIRIRRGYFKSACLSFHKNSTILCTWAIKICIAVPCFYRNSMGEINLVVVSSTKVSWILL